MRRYVLFGCGAVVLGAAAWHFGRPTPPPPRPEPAVAAAEAPKPEVPKPLPPRVIEVIDLARAYEPVREPEEARPGGVDPATFIQVPEAAERIPPAIDVDNPIQVRGFSVTTSIEADGTERLRVPPREMRPGDYSGFWGLGSDPLQDLLFFEEGLKPVRLDVMPRELPRIPSDLGNVVPAGELIFTPMGVPFTVTPEVSIQSGLLNFVPSNASIAAPVEALNVMPREVRPLINESGPRPGTHSHEPVRYERLQGKIGP